MRFEKDLKFLSGMLMALLCMIFIVLPVYAQAEEAEIPGSKEASAQLDPAESPTPVDLVEPPVDEARQLDWDHDMAVYLGILALVQAGVLVFLLVRNRQLKQEVETVHNRQVQMQRELEFQALYDPLTHLPNRRLFRDQLLQTIKLHNRNRANFGILFTDLDHFKEINDTLGHDAGDMLLVQVTERMRKSIRESDTLARLGGDEFAFICPNIHDMKSASVVCLRLIEAMQEPVILKGKSYNIGISIGVALFPQHASDDEMLVRRADMAMYRAKIKRNSFVMFDPEVDRAHVSDREAKAEPGSR